MRTVFIDTSYWIALINPKDQLHLKAVRTKNILNCFQGITTEAVLIEVANYFSAFSSEIREVVADIILEILRDSDIETVSQTRQIFLSGLTLYKARSDKGYSLTDCISMNIMRNYKISEVLTHDKHFSQEGFIILL